VPQRRKNLQSHRSRLEHRTEQLPLTGRILYRVEHYSSLAIVAITVSSIVLLTMIVVAAFGLPDRWVIAFQICTSTITIVMVFAIQHTQSREQSATQRKLDELLRVMPKAEESLMMLEEASPDELLQVAEEHRSIRSEAVERKDAEN
jgi:low affinity Fe/Cu permease